MPTARELGYPAIEDDDWFGIFVPAKTPIETVKTLNTAIRAALKTRRCQSRSDEVVTRAVRRDAGRIRPAGQVRIRPVGPDRGGIRIQGGELRCERLIKFSGPFFPLGLRPATQE